MVSKLIKDRVSLMLRSNLRAVNMLSKKEALKTLRRNNKVIRDLLDGKLSIKR